MLDRLQLGLEHLYRIETDLAVTDFLLPRASRDALGVARAAREQLLVSQDGDDLELGLFVDEAVLARLEGNVPHAHLDGDTFEDFLLAVEGVSHFVCVAWNARQQRAISALELELQAEVDKFVTCLLGREGTARAAEELCEQLFVQVAFDPALASDERERYDVANRCAHRYSRSLARRFAETRRMSDMLGELRQFYRLSLNDKFDWIAAR